MTQVTLAALLEDARRLKAALEAERAGGPALDPANQAWRDYPPAFRLLSQLSAQGADPLFQGAPVVVAVHVHPHEAMHPEVEAGMAAMQMALMAQSLDLGTCFYGLQPHAVRHDPALAQCLGLPAGHQVPICFMLGYAELRYPRLVARRTARVTWL